LRAGLGYGGSCFPKDVRALIRIGEDLGIDLSLLKEVDSINTFRIQSFIDKIKKSLWIVKDKKIAVLGLAFKPETDDIRNAPSINVINELLSEEALLRLYDPKAMENMKNVIPDNSPKIVYTKDPYEAVNGANAALIITEWDEFKMLDLRKVKEMMDNPILIDGRNLFNPEDVRSLGFEYYSIGRR
jgi:UDPglucose 6-dehydrogenase